MTPAIQVNQDALLKAIGRLTEDLDRLGAKEWHDWLQDVFERISGIRGPGVRPLDVLAFLQYNFAPMAKHVEDIGSQNGTPDPFFASFEALYVELDPLRGKQGFTLRGVTGGDVETESTILGRIASSQPVIKNSIDLVARYADAVVAKNWEQCHALITKPYQNKTSLRAFAGQHQRAAKRFRGFPVSYDICRLPVVCAGLTAPGFSWPKEVPKNQRRSVAELYFTSNAGTGLGFNAWIWSVEEAGAYRIAKLSFYTQ